MVMGNARQHIIWYLTKAQISHQTSMPRPLYLLVVVLGSHRETTLASENVDGPHILLVLVP